MNNLIDHLENIVNTCFDSFESLLDCIFPCCRICRKCSSPIRYHNTQCPSRRYDNESCISHASNTDNVSDVSSVTSIIHKQLGEEDLTRDINTTLTKLFKIKSKNNITTDNMLESVLSEEFDSNEEQNIEDDNTLKKPTNVIDNVKYDIEEWSDISEN